MKRKYVPLKISVETYGNIIDTFYLKKMATLKRK